MDYPVVITKLHDEDGGGYIARAPDLFGCISDGETPEEAIANIRDAISCWITECKNIGRTVPNPGDAAKKHQEEESAEIEFMKQLISDYDAMDDKLEELRKSLEDLHEKNENLYSWVRFAEISNHAISTENVEDPELVKIC